MIFWRGAVIVTWCSSPVDLSPRCNTGKSLWIEQPACISTCLHIPAVNTNTRRTREQEKVKVTRKEGRKEGRKAGYEEGEEVDGKEQLMSSNT